MTYRWRLLRRIIRQIWRGLRRISRPFFLFSLLVSLCIGKYSVGVNAAVGDEVLRFNPYALAFTQGGNGNGPQTFRKWSTTMGGWPLQAKGDPFFGGVPIPDAFVYSAPFFTGTSLQFYLNGMTYKSGSWSVRLGDYDVARGVKYVLNFDHIRSNNPIEKGMSSFYVQSSYVILSVIVSDSNDAPQYEKEWRLSDYSTVANASGAHQDNLVNMVQGDGDLMMEFVIPDSAADWADWKIWLDVSIGIVSEGFVGPVAPGTWGTLDAGGMSIPWVDIGEVYVNDGGEPGDEWEQEQREWMEEQRGFWARLWDFLTGMWDSIKAIPEKIGEFFSNLIGAIGDWFSQLFAAIGDWFAQLGQWLADLWDNIVQLVVDIKDWFIGLFIPEDGALQAIVDDFKLFAESKLGFVVQIFTLVGMVIGELTAGGGGDVVLTFPGFRLPSFLGGVQLWQDTPFNLTGMVNSTPAFTTIYAIYKVLASVLLLELLLRYLYRVANDILGQKDGGGDES